MPLILENLAHKWIRLSAQFNSRVLLQVKSNSSKMLRHGVKLTLVPLKTFLKNFTNIITAFKTSFTVFAILSHCRMLNVTHVRASSVRPVMAKLASTTRLRLAASNKYLNVVCIVIIWLHCCKKETHCKNDLSMLKVYEFRVAALPQLHAMGMPCRGTLWLFLCTWQCLFVLQFSTHHRHPLHQHRLPDLHLCVRVWIALNVLLNVHQDFSVTALNVYHLKNVPVSYLVVNYYQ